MEQTIIYQLALCHLNNVGDVIGKNLLSYCGSPEAIFNAKKSELLKVPNVGESIARQIISGKSDALKFAENEMKKLQNNNIKTVFYTDKDYPARLKHFNDCPLLLYYQGINCWNAERTVAIVGTRKPTLYGKDLVTEFVKKIQEFDVVIISGLAYGIDSIAHQEALNNNLKTIAVLGNGLPDIYPASNYNLAKEIMHNGALFSELPINAKPDAQNFPKRNRIVAALSDAVVVVESKSDGGSIITAGIANSYHKDVFAFPGRTTDSNSSGCNGLIKINKAAMIESADDFLYLMNWQKEKAKPKTKSIELPIFNKEQQAVYDLLKEKGKAHIDEISFYMQLSNSQISVVLLEMELNGWLRALPGKQYESCV